MENILGNGSKLMEKELYFLLVSLELKIHVKKYIPFFCMHMIWFGAAKINFPLNGETFMRLDHNG